MYPFKSTFPSTKELFTFFLPFLLSFLYLCYHAFVSQPLMINDALAYEELGQLLYDKGWKAFFLTGPNREPLYPFIVYISILLSKIFSVTYIDVLKFINIAILLFSEILVVVILRKLQVHKMICALIALYMSLSPSLLNSCLSVFSEIATYPIVLGIVCLSVISFKEIENSTPEKATAFWMGILFILIVFVKALFEFIAYLYVCVYLFLCIKKFLTGKKILSKELLKFSAVLFLTVFIPLTAYKTLNKVYNNHFVITDRGSWALYGNTARRMQATAMATLPAAIVSIPNSIFCQTILGIEKCSFWTYGPSDSLGMEKLNELKTHFPDDVTDRKLMALSFQEIFKNPFQYGLFYFLEGLKIFFWESVFVGHVVYANWLDMLYVSKWIMYGLTLFVSGLSLVSFIWCVIFMQRKTLEQETKIYLQSIMLMIVSFTCLYALFYILTRYVFTVSPLLLICVGLFLQNILFRKKSLQ